MHLDTDLTETGTHMNERLYLSDINRLLQTHFT